MAYGVQTFDSTGRKIFDSANPVLVLERVHTLTGTPIYYTSSSARWHANFNHAAPFTRITSLIQYPRSPEIGNYSYQIETEVLAGDPTADHAILAFRIPVGKIAFYFGSNGSSDILYFTGSTVKVAVIKPADKASPLIGDHGAIAYDENGEITWAANRPVVTVQGPLSMGTFEATNWFVLSSDRIRILGSSNAGATLPIGMQRTSTTTLQTKVGPGLGMGGPWDQYGADSQEASGLVLKAIDNLEDLVA